VRDGTAPFDEDGPEQGMHDPHVVAAVSELRIGQAFGTVLHLVGRDAETCNWSWSARASRVLVRAAMISSSSSWRS
jgi:hypothetical protein